MGYKNALALTFAAAFAASAQTVTAVSGYSRTEIPTHAFATAFVASNAGAVEEAIKDQALGSVAGNVIAHVGMSSLSAIPVVGSAPVVIGMLAGIGHLKKPTVKGFEVAYVQGLSAGTVVQGDSSFVVPAEAMHGSTPQLLRVKSSGKDSARMIVSTRVTYKMTGSQINPATTKVLGRQEDAVACRSEASASGEVTLTPTSPLPVGEYAIVLSSIQDVSSGQSGLVWDFRVQ